MSELIYNSGRLVRNLWLQAECLGHIVLQLFWIPLVVHFASQPISVSGARFDCIPQFVIGASSLGAGPDHAASAGQHTADDVVPGMGGIADGTREDILSIVFGGRITRSRNLSRALSEIKWECDILHSPGGSAPKWGGEGLSMQGEEVYPCRQHTKPEEPRVAGTLTTQVADCRRKLSGAAL